MQYKKFNIYTGWFVFTVALIVYLITLEDTVSFWDCGEFIACGYKLEVGHAPGAPLYIMLARIFSLFAGKDVTKVALMINALSAIVSAFTILFLFWTITYFAKQIIFKGEHHTKAQIITVLGSGLVGTLAYTFSDSFWFSAVEGEVYATSSLITAVVFWAILRWEASFGEKHNNRWLILIAYLLGLSVGIHLLNLLALPAIVFVFYFKRYKKVTKRGILAAFLVSALLLGFILYAFIPGIVKFSQVFELFFVNSFSLPFNSGAIFYVLALIALFTWGFYYTMRKKKVVLNTCITVLFVMFIGYSSYAMVVIRSMAHTPVNMGSADNVFSLLNYLNRESYGSRPLFYGHYYNAPLIDYEDRTTYTPWKGKYKKTPLNPKPVYDKKFCTIFPRMYSNDGNHIDLYKKWITIKGRPVKTRNAKGELVTQYKPTFGENLKFFFRYQLGYMYFRYFFWNFVGRQNDDQGFGNNLYGNWLSGIRWIDEWRLGSQENLPDKLQNNKARNTYFFLPLLLGIAGMMYHYKNSKRNFFIILLFFFFTGIAIIMYLNEIPQTPRERDYVYVGSFYAFSIWIGLGVLYLYQILNRIIPALFSSVLSIILCGIFVPGIMARENWDDHDRSDRSIARDMAYNCLTSCASNAILFTTADNDTYPLWYAQEVEGIRTDIKLVLIPYLSTNWFVDHMRRATYEAKGAPISLTTDKFLQGERSYVPISKQINEYIDLKQAIEFIGSDNRKTKKLMSNREYMDYIPSHKIALKVNKQNVLKNGDLAPQYKDNLPDVISWEIKRNAIFKHQLLILDILATNDWERPVYFMNNLQASELGFKKYLHCEGFVYRLVPYETHGDAFLNISSFATDTFYHKMMKDFRWGNLKSPEIFIDYTSRRYTSTTGIRKTFNNLAVALAKENKKKLAVEVLDKCIEVMPPKNLPYNYFTLGIITTYFSLGEVEKGKNVLFSFYDTIDKNLFYLTSLKEKYRRNDDMSIRQDLYMLQELLKISKEYISEKEWKKMEEKFVGYYEMSNSQYHFVNQ